ncbi:31050_t:CDS:2, partial [Gigaspora margarita]
ENEFTRDAPELTRQDETNSMSKIKNLVTKNNTRKPDNSKGKDKVNLQETHIQKQEKKFKQPLLNKENKLKIQEIKLLKKQAPKKESHQETVDKKLKEEQIDIEWNRLSNAIQEAANKHIPWSKAKKTDFICKKVIPNEHSRFNIQIEQINEKNMMEIPPLPNIWNLKEIQSKVESRFGITNKNRKRMLLSLLNKPVNKIKIDRVLKEKKNFYQNSELVVKETE